MIEFLTENVLFIAIFLYALVLGAFTSHVASAKGHSADTWFLGGLFFGVFALIAIAGMPTKEDMAGEEEEESEEPEETAPEEDHSKWMGKEKE